MNNGALHHAREFAGVLLKDWWRYRRNLSARDASYLSICNRAETLERAPDGSGWRCNWRWTSDLHAPRLMPQLGADLMRRALQDHPIHRAHASSLPAQDAPQVSFIIGHRGTDRVPHLLTTLESIAGQRGASLECIVVEQDAQPHLPGRLPAWVQYVHTPLPAPAMPYCRAWAFNVGAKRARAPILVLHDNDMLAPADYASGVVERVRKGYEAINLKRFIFYLEPDHTAAVLDAGASLTCQAPQTIVQNLEGGGSVAITRNGYERIGGLDESFVGWGGEDNEFWERAQTLNVWPYAHLPLVHLWHPAQPGKHQAGNEMLALYRERSSVSVTRRIGQLCALPRGDMSGPHSVSANREEC
jgi:hypothetical protein